MKASESRRLAALQERLGQLAQQLAAVGFVPPGSVVRRFMPCGKPGCRCQADPPVLHGPYWQWTRKVKGKTVTRRLTEPQARVYLELIANRRRLRKILSEMEQVSERAAQILLRGAAAASPAPRPAARPRKQPREG